MKTASNVFIKTLLAHSLIITVNEIVQALSNTDVSHSDRDSNDIACLDVKINIYELKNWCGKRSENVVVI